MSSTSLEARIQRLEDIEAIKQLKAEYCAACDDDHNPDRLAEIFVEDGIWDWEGTALLKGHAQIKQWMGTLRGSGRIRNSAHMVFNPVINVNGDSATAHWRFQMLYTGNLPGDTVQYFRIIGYYQDDHVRRNGKWYFQTLRPRVEENTAYATEEERVADAAK